MNGVAVQAVQNDVRSPTGQRGADVMRRPPSGGQQQGQQTQSQQGVDNGGKERPISRGELASQPYPYRPEQGQQPAPAQQQNPSPEQRQQVEQGRENQNPDENLEQSPGEWSRRYAQIQRRERQIYQQAQSLQRFEQQLREREARVRSHEETQGLAKSDPKQFIEKNGLSYEQLTDIYLNEGKPTTEHVIKSLQDEITTLRQRLDNDQVQSKETEAQQKIEGFKSEIRATIEQQTDERFQLIKAQNAFDTVFQVIESYFEKTKKETGFGIILPIAEAADYVENDLYQSAQAYLNIPKLQKGQQSAAPRVEEQQPARQAQSPQQSSQPQRQPSRPQQSTHGQNSIVRDQSGVVGGINNLSYAQQTRRQAAGMLRFNH